MPDFWKITPGGNPTILLETGAVPRALRARAAAEIMDPLHLSGEQVGFVRFASPSEPTPRLDMMGGGILPERHPGVCRPAGPGRLPERFGAG